MKYFLAFLSSFCLLIACNHSNEAIKQRIADSDSVAINYFKGDGTIDTVAAVKIIRDKKKIEQLAALISSETIESKPNCGYDGSLHFFKIDKVTQDIDFRLNNDQCRYFSFMQQGKIQSTVLSNEAKELINSFRK
ncbi:MAG: hypothetical protein ABIN01_01910 [Ferruginibacter sp.]